jgi:hypothetical protein
MLCGKLSLSTEFRDAVGLGSVIQHVVCPEDEISHRTFLNGKVLRDTRLFLGSELLHDAGVAAGRGWKKVCQFTSTENTKDCVSSGFR